MTEHTTSVRERIITHLADLPGDIGCRHLARQRDQVPGGLLVDLKLVKPIVSRVPTCAAHACPQLGTCEYSADFEPEASGRKSGVKYRRSADGDVVATGVTIPIDTAIAELTPVPDMLAALENQPLTLFELHAVLLEQSRSSVRKGTDPFAACISRGHLLSLIDLLQELELVRRAADGRLMLGGSSH